MAASQNLANITNILGLWMAKAELPASGQFLSSGLLSADVERSYQTMSEVYSTRAATTTVRMRPGTSPSTEYEYGNDMMAKQMYSAKSRHAV
jgi:hypothetical protein